MTKEETEKVHIWIDAFYYLATNDVRRYDARVFIVRKDTHTLFARDIPLEYDDKIRVEVNTHYGDGQYPSFLAPVQNILNDFYNDTNHIFDFLRFAPQYQNGGVDNGN